MLNELRLIADILKPLLFVLLTLHGLSYVPKPMPITDGIVSNVQTTEPIEPIKVDIPKEVKPATAIENKKPVVKPTPVKTYVVTGNKQDWLRQAGIAESDWRYVDYIVHKESTWNPQAVNKSSGACSLVQALPCSKIGSEWRNPVTALKWQKQYVAERYGGYAQAYSFWLVNNWY